jgi:hypothetical protein
MHERLAKIPPNMALGILTISQATDFDLFVICCASPTADRCILIIIRDY